MSEYLRSFDETNYIPFFIKYEKMLIAYNKVWNKVSNIMQKGFGSESVYY